MRTGFRAIVTSFLLVLMCGGETQAANRPNVLMIIVDDMNDWVGFLDGYPGKEHTPNLDRLAERGVLFQSAYTNCPICVPARASLATGQYVHSIRYWDNAFPYDGAVKGWGHRLIESGHRVDSVGKLHYRSHEDDEGEDEAGDDDSREESHQTRDG